MKTITDFLASESSEITLTIKELMSIKGGDDPGGGETDPFKKKG